MVVKEDLVTDVSNATGIRKQDVRNIINVTMETIKKALRREKVTLVGFGTFELAERKARRGRNPQTEEVMTIPAHKVPVFRFGKAARQEITKDLPKMDKRRPE